MTGFTLPKLRWLVLGAAAAGLWAMTQDIPRQNEAAKQPRREATAKAPTQRVARAPEAESRKRVVSTDRTEKIVTPARIEPPQPRPSEMTTSSIPRPSQPVGPTAAAEKVYTTSRVRLRAKGDLSSAVVTTLSPGQALRQLSRKGKWHLVSVDGKKGWVHGDYLSAMLPRGERATVAVAPRPKQAVARAEPAASRQKPASAVARQPDPVRVSDRVDMSSSWAGMRPARAPQGGDCQCPYDLMLSGKQCGDHSAYARRTAKVQCYF